MVSRRFFDMNVDLTNPAQRSRWMMDLSMMLDDLVGAANPGWTTPPFNAGNFTASGSMIWTVEAGDVTTYQSMIIGKTMWVNFCINTSTVGGTLSDILSIKIPLGKVSKEVVITKVGYLDDSGTLKEGRVKVSSGGTVLSIYLYVGGNFAASTNGTHVIGQIFFEIQ